MAPAFSSTRHALAFALIVALLLAAPQLLSRVATKDRSGIYPGINLKSAPASAWIQRQIFSETGDVDLVFVGASLTLNDIDANFAKHYFSEHVGREASVFTIGWLWRGYDAMYFIARDLLEHRRVRVMVMTDVNRLPDRPHPVASRWYRFGENPDEIDGLSVASKLRLYCSAVLGAPRHFLSLLRHNVIVDQAQLPPNYVNKYYYTTNLAENLGGMKSKLAYKLSGKRFVEYAANGDASRADALLYSPATRDQFTFTGPSTEGYQLHFARKLARLCQEKGTRLVMLAVPELIGQDTKTVTVREDFAESWGAPVDIIGIPNDRFFAGISSEDRNKLFYDDFHLNKNGQEYFTPLVTPLLMELYDAALKDR